MQFRACRTTYGSTARVFRLRSPTNAATLVGHVLTTGGLDTYAFGYNRYYQLGNRKRANTAEPVPVISMTNKNRRWVCASAWAASVWAYTCTSVS